ncbi:PQ loop repeat-domain-containing protein [Coemansia spiralis]|nr:PQ loop repeat-domain-containing protein [Coemansia spiralis]
MPWNEVVSDVLGYFSIGCWLIVFAPQIYENYQRKSGDGVSLLFLYIWILGDIFGLIGAVQQSLIVTAIVLYTYYFLADAVLLAQIHYYSYLRKQAVQAEHEHAAEPLLSDIEANEEQIGSANPHQRLNTSIFLPIAVVFVLANAAGIIKANIASIAATSLDSQLLSKTKAEPKRPELVPQILGYTSAILFLGARIPQLIKNYRKKSCNGLSIGMFIFSILGNVAFTLSLLLHSLDSSYLLANVPWIVGSTGTLFFDLAIFYQFYIYHESSRQAATA